MANAYMTGMGKGILRALEPKAIKETMDLCGEMKAAEIMREEAGLMATEEKENLLVAKRKEEENNLAQWEKDNAETKAFSEAQSTPTEVPGALGKPLKTENPKVIPEATATNQNTVSAMKGTSEVNTNVDIKPNVPGKTPTGAMPDGEGRIPKKNTATVVVEDTVPGEDLDKLPRNLPDVKNVPKPYAVKPIAASGKDYYEKNFSYLSDYQKQGQLMQRVAWRLRDLGYADQANKFSSDAAAYEKKHTESVWTKVTDMSMASDTDGMKNMLKRMGWKNLESVSFSANEDGDGQDINFRMANGVVSKMDKSTFESMSPSLQSQTIRAVAAAKTAAEAKLAAANMKAIVAAQKNQETQLVNMGKASFFGKGTPELMQYVNNFVNKWVADTNMANKDDKGGTKPIIQAYLNDKRKLLKDALNNPNVINAIQNGLFTEEDLYKYLSQPINNSALNSVVNRGTAQVPY